MNDNALNKLEALQQFNVLFRNFTPEDLQIISENVKYIQLQKEDYLFYEGSQGRDIYLIISGKLAIMKEGFCLDVLYPGNFLGEISILDNEARSASICAISLSELYALNFDDLSLHHPQIASKLILNLSQKLTTLIRNSSKYLVTAQKTQSHLQGILHDLDAATEIQQSILPHIFIHNRYVDLYAKMIAARKIGGDFHDFFWLNREKTLLAFLVADVSGKGISAALFMTVARTLIRGHAFNYPNATGRCLTKVNDILEKDNVKAMFVTAFYGILDLKTGILTFTNAGHNPPCIIRKESGTELLSKNHGTPLGVEEGLHYKEDRIILYPGDTLFLYTDGVIEAEDSHSHLYGVERLILNLNQYKSLKAKPLINAIRSNIATFATGCLQSDDITMLVVKYIEAK